MNERQNKRLSIDSRYKTRQGNEIRSFLQQAGVDRLDKFGDMNIIDDFCQLYPAYKHDDVFMLEWIFVVERMERNTIIENIKEQINQFYVDKQKKV